MDKKLTQGGLLTHFFFVTLFLIIPTLAFVRPPGEPAFAITKVFAQDTIANFVLLCFFYLNYYILLPKYFFRHQYVLYVLAVLLFLSFALTLPYIVGKYFPGAKWDPPPPSATPHGDLFEPAGHAPRSIVSFVFDEFRRHLFLFFSAVFFSFLLKTREHLSELKEDKLKAELSSLKSQINPHFLFNTLNSIYALSVKKDDRTPGAILNLSGLMRYVIKDANDYKIPLSREIEYITNYVDLQKARLGNTAVVNFDCSGTAGDKEIAPLILITYIENAFKYGVNPDVEDCLVQVSIQITDTGLSMFVYNKKVPLAATIDSTGIGVSNTAERLKLLYAGKHSIEVKENESTYSVMLSLQLV
ncbi:sensor histidine kinase [Ferruginibacter sp.]